MDFQSGAAAVSPPVRFAFIDCQSLGHPGPTHLGGKAICLIASIPQMRSAGYQQVQCWSEQAGWRQSKTAGVRAPGLGVRAPGLSHHTVLGKQEPEGRCCMSLRLNFLACEELWPMWSLIAISVIIRRIAAVYSLS